jgi:hypothetical protein
MTPSWARPDQHRNSNRHDRHRLAGSAGRNLRRPLGRLRR